MTRLVPVLAAPTVAAPLSAARGDAIRVQALDGTWETCGRDRLRGIYPELRGLSANDWGSDKASFDLKRNPGSVWPDLTKWTPVEVDVAGRTVWIGRLQDNPAREGAERVIAVQCEGLQYHLDDDTYLRKYVHTQMGDYKDMRSVLTANLGNAALFAGGQVASDGGITLGVPNGQYVTAGGTVGVVLDLGDTTKAKRIVVQWESSNNTALWTFYARGSDYPDNVSGWGAGAFDDAFTFLLNSGASGTTAGTFTTAHRYVHLFINDAATTGNAAAEFFVKVKGVQVFSDTAYESGNVSVLKATDVVKDALSRATVFFSADRSRVGQTSFNIPAFAPDDDRTPREAWQAADAFHDWAKYIDLQGRPVYEPRPTAAAIEVGPWAGADYQDAGDTGGDAIFNHVVVQGQGPDGEKLRVERVQPATAAQTTALSTPAPDNPSFATNISSWTASAGTLARTTTAGEYDTAPAGGKWTGASATATLIETFTGTFTVGRTYQLTLNLKQNVAGAAIGLSFEFGAFASADTSGSQLAEQPTSFTTVTMVWTPQATRTSGVTLRITSHDVNPTYFIDSLTLALLTPTLPDRRGFRKTKILQLSQPTNVAVMQKIGDVYLNAHKTQPMKGKLAVTGQGGARNILTGERYHPAHLLPLAPQRIRLAHRIDPDTGGLGRDGQIANVDYDPAAETASVDVDDQRDKLQPLLERLGVLTPS